MANSVLELEWEELQDFFDLSPEEIDRLTRVAGRASESPASPQAQRTMENLRSIKESLEGQFEPEEIERWLHAPNPTFGGTSPIDLIAQGETDQILETLIRLEAGIHN
jgi:uncharacterized protein (DUF2384 family)